MALIFQILIDFLERTSVKKNNIVLRQLANLVQLAIVSYLPCFKPLPNNHGFNSLPNYKLLDRAKLKAFTANKLSDGLMMISAIDRVENCGKRRKREFSHIVFKNLIPWGC